MGGAKLTVFPEGEGGNLTRQSPPGSSASQWKILLISTSKTVLHLIYLNFKLGYLPSLLSWRNLLRMTANIDHKSNEFGYKATRLMGKFLRRKLRQCDPASYAFFSRNKNSGIYINKWYPDYRSKQCASIPAKFTIIYVSYLYFLAYFSWFVKKND